MKDPAQTKQPTIYNYTLIKRFHIKREHLYLYIFSFMLSSLILIVIGGWIQFISILLSCVLLLLVQTLIISVCVKVMRISKLRHWSFQWQFPWVGLLPELPISTEVFKFIHIQQLFIGYVLIACFIPWISPIFMMNLVFVHTWILLPRMLVILMLLAQKTDLTTVLIKMNSKDISLYKY
jgi:hypothetical protein